VAGYQRIVILTGAGISAESGLGTFRDAGGLWTQYDLNDVATPEGFARNPALVHDFYNQRRRNVLGARPNPAHRALAELERAYRGRVLVVTQNVDDLHERAGSRNLLHMHGELLKARCDGCGAVADWTGDMTSNDPCPACGTVGRLRPHVVWFGEMPLHLERIYPELAACDLFISIGTSGQVYPAAGFVAEAGGRAHTVELNLAPSDGHGLFAEQVYGPASQVVPDYVRRLLGD
jgi:NAD-dependent deacetylase